MQVYLQELADFYDQELVLTVYEDRWPNSFDTLQEWLAEANLVALTYPFSRQSLARYLRRRRVPFLLVQRDWKRFYLALPTADNKWEFWQDDNLLGTFTPSELMQQGIGENLLAYLIVPRGFFASPFVTQATKPWSRLFQFFSAERQLVAYIYLYAIVSGGALLLVPLVIQAIFSYVQTLQQVSGLATMIVLAILILIVGAFVRLGQYVLMENLQRRLFLHSTLEIVHHVPRWFFPAVVRENLPGLVNRYFEIFTLEKNIAKLLINIPADIVTIVFGLALFFLYVFFSKGYILAISAVLLTVIVGLLLYYSFWPAYKKKKAVSDEKYRMASWLEEIARSLLTFKVAGFPPILYRRTQDLEERYLRAREQYFRALLWQKGLLYFYQISLAALMIGVGAWLVTEDQRLSLGAFVASEVVLVIILNAVQDLVGQLDALYDAFVGMDKLSQLFTQPQEKTIGLQPPPKPAYQVTLQNLVVFQSRGNGQVQPILRNICLEVEAGEKVCLTGPSGSGKTSLLYVLYGLYPDYRGEVYIEGMNLRHLNLVALRARIGDALDVEEIVEATVWENLTLGARDLSWDEVMRVCERLGLKEVIERLPQGFFTPLPPRGRGVLSGLDQRRLILARALLMHPALLFVDDLFATVDWPVKGPIYEYILSPTMPYTALVVSQDPRVMQLCDRIILLQEGEIRHVGGYKEVLPLVQAYNPFFRE
ncbi:MAG: ATP-binding cassette domain-containing protein [Bacteroidia bacterium]|nr:ATP-binding cassette domain-containing protein [Bacteroidia bacterium]MDW8088817.1 ATP-binding cassette domain-containing protein [Bacteroidia bacterium]